jgi:hypothetical protein
VGDLYRQQLRLHAFKFWNCRLSNSQMVTLRRVDESHSYGTRSARSGLAVGSGDHRLVAYRVHAEWRTLTEKQRGALSGAPRGTFWCSKGFFSVGWWDVGCVGTAVRGMGTLRVREWVLLAYFSGCGHLMVFLWG